MTSVIGVDPGEAVGIFDVSVLRFHKLSNVNFRYAAYQLSPETAHQYVQVHLQSSVDTLVACEAYIITARTARLTQQRTAIEVIGDLKQLCREHDTPFALQMKSDAAKLARDSVLKRIGWWQPGKRHANDAARQALLALATVDPSALQTLLTSDTIVSTCR